MIDVHLEVGAKRTFAGAPDVAPSADGRPVDETELRRFLALLKGCWRAFDADVERASGKELRKGPRERPRPRLGDGRP